MSKQSLRFCFCFRRICNFRVLKRRKIFSRRSSHFEAFRYLLGVLNGPLSPTPEVHHDMTEPLAHYFLYTGHNSYLTGNQLSSESSVEPIIRALLRGVRVIELDLWPNSTEDEVVVRHGGALTNPVDLLKCLNAIKDNAFQASEYPVVINFEDHLTPNLQAKVAMMVTKTFKDILFCPESDQLQEFPSPESLKKRVMISTKTSKEYLESQSSKAPQKLKWSSRTEEWNDEKTASEDEETYDKDKIDEGSHLSEEDEEMTVPEYKHLIAIQARKWKDESKNWLNLDKKKVRSLSLSEQEVDSVTRSHVTDLVRFTQRNLLRIYPKGTRITSSNYNPFLGWIHGAQMVAFNMQGYGKHLWVMQGMFRANGGCGYVKKPDFLLSKEVFDPTAQLPVKKILKVKIYMGEGWDRDLPPDLFVKVGIAGVPADVAKRQTKTIEDNWKPVWNEEFEFKLTIPELAVLWIEVRDYDISGMHDFGGQTSLPISELRTGIRAVPLHDRRGDQYKNTKLLMQFEFN